MVKHLYLKGIALAFLILTVTAIVIADVNFGRPPLNLSTDTYGPNQPFQGYINVSLSNVDADSDIIFELRNSETIIKKFPLLNILRNQSIAHSCEPSNCKSLYTASSPSTSKNVVFDCANFPCNKTEIGLKIESTSRIGDVTLAKINFTIKGSDSGGYPTPSIDVGNDGSIEWRYLEPSDTFAQIPNNFDSNNKLGERTFDGNWEYCQNITLPASKRFKFSTSNLENVASIQFNLRRTTRFPIERLASCNATANSACIANYTVTESKDFLLCTFSTEGKIPYYGGGGKRAYFFNKQDSSASSQPYDFPIFAEYALFRQLDFTLSLTEPELRAIKDAIQLYLLQSCDRAAQNCTVPLTTISSTRGTIMLENLKIEQNKWPPESNFYSVQKEAAKLRMNLSRINLAKTELRTPTPNNYPNNYDESWKIKAEIDSESTSEVEFEIAQVPIPRVKPLVGLVAFPITFDASTSSASNQLARLVSFEWDFGDTQKITTTTPQATHTYASAGNYTLTLKATDNTGLTGTGTFTIRIGSSLEAVGEIIKQIRSNFNQFKTSLPADQFERNLIIKRTIGSEQVFMANLTELNDTYNYVLTLSGAQQEQRLATLFAIIQAMEVPSDSFDSLAFSTEIVPDLDIVNPVHVMALTGETQQSSEAVKNAIAAWQQENVALSMSGKVKSVEYTDRTEELFSIVRISIQPSVVSEYYLILQLPGDVIEYKSPYNSKDISAGVVGLALTSEREVVFAMDSADIAGIKVFASPPLSELAIIGSVCGDGYCSADEDSEFCPADCGKKVSGLATFLIILFILIGAAVIFFIWRNYAKTYKQRLFKSKRDYESILAFIKKNLLLKISLSEIKSKLKKAGWTDEQIEYALKEALEEETESSEPKPRTERQKRKFFFFKK